MKPLAADWASKASCNGQPTESWYPDRPTEGTDAIRICREECPVRRECGEDAIKMDERWGIVAGFRCSTQNGRNELRAWLGLPPESRQCRACGGPVPGRLMVCHPCRGEVLAAPALDHIAALRGTGMTLAAVAKGAGMSVTSLKSVLYGGRNGKAWEYMSRRNFNAIVAVPIPERVAS